MNSLPYRICNIDDDKPVPRGKLGILENSAYVTVDMEVDVKKFVTAYKKFTRAINQAVADGVLPQNYFQFVTADSDSEEDIKSVCSAQTRDIHFDVDDNTDIDAGFYFKCAVSKEFLDMPQDVMTLEAQPTQELVPVQAAGAVQNAEQTFDSLVDEWFCSDAMFRVHEQSKKSYRKSLKAFCAWCMSQGIIEPSKDDVKTWCNSMDADKLSVATKNLRLTTLRNFYKWLSSEYGKPNIAESLKGWKETKEHRRGFLSLPEMKKLLAVVEPTAEKRIADKKKELEDAKAKAQEKGKNFNRDSSLKHFEKTARLQCLRDKAILAVLLAAGLRTIEINRLRVGDITHKGGVCYLSVIGKGRDEGEDVKLSYQAEQLIQVWLAAREKIDIVSDDSPLFCSLGNNSYGEPISANSVSTLCKEYLTAAGFKTPQIVAHSLRHSLATNSLAEGGTLREVQQQLRHKNLTTTQVYLHEVDKARNRCTNLISDKIF